MEPCLALFSFLQPYSGSCGVFDTAMATRFSQEIPMEGVHRTLSMPQFRVQGSYVQDGIFALVRADMIRSASDGSYIGIDGESLVWRIHRAQFGWQQDEWLFQAGVIDDLWVFSQNEAWFHRNVYMGTAESVGLMDRSDIGIMGQFHNDRFSFRIRLSSGEGVLYQERNNGFNSQVQAAARFGPHTVSVFGQEGSRGWASTREHRLGVRFSSKHKMGYGAELLKAWGVQANGELQVLTASTWFRTLPQKGFWGYIRADVVAYDEPALIRGLTGLAWGLDSNLHLLMGTRQEYFLQGGYQATSSQRWQQEYFLQLQYSTQRAISF